MAEYGHPGIPKNCTILFLSTNKQTAQCKVVKYGREIGLQWSCPFLIQEMCIVLNILCTR